jgi:hypothetical protein
MEQLLLSGSVHIALRTFFIGLSAFNGSLNKLEKFMDEIDKQDKNFSIFDFNFSKACNVKNHLKYLNTLARSNNNFSLQTHGLILENHPDLSEMYKNNKTFIQSYLLRQCQTNDHYFHGIFGKNLRARDSQSVGDLQQSIGSGFFPFACLINHSCVSNIMRIYVNGKVALVASRFIPANSQLFDCYKLELYSSSI